MKIKSKVTEEMHDTDALIIGHHKLSAGHTGLRIAYHLRINFPRSVDRSDSVDGQAYPSDCWARMSPVLTISNRCDSTYDLV